MKRPVIFLQFFLCLGISLAAVSTAYSQNSSLEINLKNNEQIKNEVFRVLLNDRKLFNDLLDGMTRNPQTINWIMDHRRIRQELYNPDHMHRMMMLEPERNKEMMLGLINMIKQDSTVYNQVLQSIQQ
ncbi:MAG: hypothetical protein KFF73_05295 [Cyclobacteriaceae bacterium]|nr:hypothetical protein [Cyclobacteriaceae bacterium]